MNNNMSEEKIKQYAIMAKQFMNRPIGHPNNVVGNYGWHEKYPYEKYLLYRPSNENESVVDIDNTLIGIDFGCGPGRMVKRMSKFFKRVYMNPPRPWMPDLDINHFMAMRHV